MPDPLPASQGQFLPWVTTTFCQRSRSCTCMERPTGAGLMQQRTLMRISVATAARLSATFPYVSSAARIPAEFAPYAFHFVDGGYFDNDGTSSVIEFLMHAFGRGPWLESEQPASQSTGRVADYRDTGRVPILLIEIRQLSTAKRSHA